MLILESIRCDGTPSKRGAFTKLATLSFPHRTISLERLEVPTGENPEQLRLWLPLIRFFNPEELVLQPAGGPLQGVRPSAVRVPFAKVAPLKRKYWTRLKVVSCLGPHSVPLLKVDAKHTLPWAFAFTHNTGPKAKKKRRVVSVHYGVLKDGHVSGPNISEAEIEEVLEKPWEGPSGSLVLVFFLTGSSASHNDPA